MASKVEHACVVQSCWYILLIIYVWWAMINPVAIDTESNNESIIYNIYVLTKYK